MPNFKITSDFAKNETKSEKIVEDEQEIKRENWTGRFDFILSVIGYAVGLGNLWRFPYLCFKNGGGAFLIPYVIMLVLTGLPLFFMEMAFAQFASLSPVAIWLVSPIFKGVGWSMVIICAMVTVYYNVIVAWSLYYLVISFRKTLLWSGCDNSWNDHKCSMKFNASILDAQTPAEQFWEREVLGLVDEKSGRQRKFDEPLGKPQWHLSIALVVAWLGIFLTLSKGVKTSGKVVYVTATLPYILLTVLFIYGLTLDGSTEGIKFYIVPKWDKLKDYQIWVDAATQIFYSLGVGFGTLHSMSSYNKFKNNCYFDAILVAAINCFTSIFAGFVIFSFLGFSAKMILGDGNKVEEVVQSGPGLAFIAYPQALADMPVGPLWSVLFFFMLLFLGVDSQFSMVETIVSGIADEFPKQFQSRKRKVLLVGIICLVLCLLGIPLICEGGIYYFQILNDRSASFSLTIAVAFEIVALSYVYGIRNFCKDIKMMLGFEPNYYWKATWFVITPLMILLLFVFSCISFEGVGYGDYSFPAGAQVFGIILIIIGGICIPIFMVYKTIRYQSVIKASQPEDAWGPRHNGDRMLSDRYEPLYEFRRQNGDEIEIKAS